MDVSSGTGHVGKVSHTDQAKPVQAASLLDGRTQKLVPAILKEQHMESETEVLEVFPSLLRLSELRQKIDSGSLIPRERLAVAKELAMIRARVSRSPAIQQEVDRQLNELKRGASPDEMPKLIQIISIARNLHEVPLADNFDATLATLLAGVPQADLNQEAHTIFRGDSELAMLHMAKRLVRVEGGSYSTLKAISSTFQQTAARAFESENVAKVIVRGQALVIASSQIGQGGKRTVHLAETIIQQQGQEVTSSRGVVKLPKDVTDDEGRQEMQHEAEVMMKLRGQAGIIGFHTLSHGGNTTVIEELAGFVQGGETYVDVDKYLDVVDTMSNAEKLAFYGKLTTVLDGLIAMRDRNITYRDLKPDNIMMMPDGSLKISDFGFAVVGAATDAKGTLFYMAPEMFYLQVSEKSDVWAFGMTLRQMLGTSSLEEHPIFNLKMDASEAEGFAVMSQYHAYPDPDDLSRVEVNLKEKGNYESRYPEPQDKNSLEHLIWQCTRFDPKDRPTLEQAKAEFQRILPLAFR